MIYEEAKEMLTSATNAHPPAWLSKFCASMTRELHDIQIVNTNHFLPHGFTVSMKWTGVKGESVGTGNNMAATCLKVLLSRTNYRNTQATSATTAD